MIETIQCQRAVALAVIAGPANASEGYEDGSPVDNMQQFSDGEWSTESGSWSVQEGQLIGSGTSRFVFCNECSPERPLTNARLSFQVLMPAADVAGTAPTLKLGFRNDTGRGKMGLRLSGLGTESVSSLLVRTAGGEDMALDSGASNTKREWTLPVGSIQNVELEWREGNVFYRLWPQGQPRPGAPAGGYTIDSLDIWPNSAEIQTSDGLRATITGYAIEDVEAGYPKQLDPPEQPADPNGWKTQSGTWSENSDGSLTSSSDGSDAAVIRTICATCEAGASVEAATVTADIVVPVSEDLADQTWASVGLALAGADTDQRLYRLGLVGQQSKLSIIRSNSGSESRIVETSFTWTPGERYTFELSWASGEYGLRVWPSTQSRPEDAQSTFSIESFTPVSGGFRQWGVQTATYRDFTVTNLAETRGDAPAWVTTSSHGLYYPTEKNILPARSYDEMRPELPTPVADADPKYVEMYNQTWRIMLSKNLLEPSESSPLVRTYVDSGFDPAIMFQWDTLFSLQYALYGERGFDMIATLDNWYVLQRPTGEIRRAVDTRTGETHPWAAGANGVNPPLFAWVELSSFKKSGDLDRVRRVLPALRAYADWVSIQQWSQAAPHQLFWNNGNGNGMDNLPTQLDQGGNGAGSGVASVDISSQMVMMRNSLAALEEAAGNTQRAAADRAWAEDIASRIQDFMWDGQDARFYEVDAKGEHWKVDSLAGFWPMLAAVTSPEQATRLVDALKDPAKYWTDMVFPALAKTDSRYDPKGHYWRGGVWAPATFATIKGIEASGDRAFAETAAKRYLDGIVEVYNYSGTIFELYAPERQPADWILNSATGHKSGQHIPIVLPDAAVAADQDYISPGTDDAGSAPNVQGGSDYMGKPDFAGWTGLAPIALLIEDVIGIQTDMPAGVIDWNLHRTDRNGIENLSLGQAGVLSMIAEPRASGSADAKICFDGELERPMTVRVHLAGSSSDIPLTAGPINTCKTVSQSDPQLEIIGTAVHDGMPSVVAGDQLTVKVSSLPPSADVIAVTIDSDAAVVATGTVDSTGSI